MSRRSVGLLNLPNELLSLILQYSISKSTETINAELDLEDPFSPRFYDQRWLQDQFESVVRPYFSLKTDVFELIFLNQILRQSL